MCKDGDQDLDTQMVIVYLMIISYECVMVETMHVELVLIDEMNVVLEYVVEIIIEVNIRIH